MRCLQAPLSYESKLLPDHDTLQDRMSVIAYEAGLAKGADTSAAALGVQAIEVGQYSTATSLSPFPPVRPALLTPPPRPRRLIYRRTSRR